MEYVYLTHISNVRELNHSTNVRNRTLRPQTYDINEVYYLGSHPWLELRKVKDFKVHTDSKSGFESVSWIEYPKTKWDDLSNRFIETVPLRKKLFTRTIQGPLKFERVWDQNME